MGPKIYVLATGEIYQKIKNNRSHKSKLFIALVETFYPIVWLVVLFCVRSTKLHKIFGL